MGTWSVMLFVLVGCSSQTDESRSCTAATCRVEDAQLIPTPLSLCAICGDDSECGSGICKMYGDGYRKCSLTCATSEAAPQCAAPADGACNGMGYCMCPFYSPPADAGDGDAQPKDAAMAPTSN